MYVTAFCWLPDGMEAYELNRTVAKNSQNGSSDGSSNGSFNGSSNDLRYESWVEMLGKDKYVKRDCTSKEAYERDLLKRLRFKSF